MSERVTFALASRLGEGIVMRLLDKSGDVYSLTQLGMADDTLAVVARAQLNRNVATWAYLLYLVADSGVDFRRSPAK